MMRYLQTTKDVPIREALFERLRLYAPYPNIVHGMRMTATYLLHILTHTTAHSYTQANDDPSLQPLELCALFRIYASGILCEKYLQPAAAVLLVSILHAVAKNPTCRARYGECFES